ncbi:hypothetical protein [Mycobacteroides abscessus]|uniref:hypothetical protein n=1 Tax=Mycobacteroides abscessus TaxID=36809 RepID=UPI0009A7CBD9|nr:hypothetical protein [Mycobacteroides abscessus]SLC41765.1 Uncharacterised protein [Mycobacteroides abscessus subsp. abscessus]
MHYLTPSHAAADIRSMRTKITEIERWRDAADELFTGASFAAAVDIAEAEILMLETEILTLCERFGISEEPYGDAVAA